MLCNEHGQGPVCLYVVWQTHQSTTSMNAVRVNALKSVYGSILRCSV